MESSPQASPAPSATGTSHPSPSAVATLNPAYFALVMATGIVSVASHLLGLALVPRALWYANILFYAVLWALTLIRIIRYPQQVKADLLHHGRCVGFFTTVAATCVLGTQFLVVGQMREVAVPLWFAGIILWAVLTYAIFSILTVKQHKTALPEGINGGWLVAVVAAQSVAVLGAQLAAGFAPYKAEVLFFCVAMWLGGGMLYIWIISLIFYRYTFFSLHPSDLAPPYWVNMGAVAISTLAGTMLIANAEHSPALMELLPFLKGFTMLFWATATWWIPMLLILGIWRHLYCRFPLRYDPLYWGLVFPLGMYTACTYRLAHVVNAPFLLLIPQGFIYLALAAWLLTFAGLVHHLVNALSAGRAGGGK